MLQFLLSLVFPLHPVIGVFDPCRTQLLERNCITISFLVSLHLLHGDHEPQLVHTGHPGNVHLDICVAGRGAAQPVARICVPKLTHICGLLCVPEPQVTLHGLH